MPSASTGKGARGGGAEAADELAGTERLLSCVRETTTVAGAMMLAQGTDKISDAAAAARRMDVPDIVSRSEQRMKTAATPSA
jgi:hypothetical protein